MIEDLDALRLWIALRVPKIEDGNNFSVSVQDDIIGILASGKTSGLALIDSINRNLSARGEVMRKVMKYPHVADYAHTLYEMDVQQQSVLMHTCIDLRNNYAILFDLINKNFVHLQHPKGPNEHAIGML
jgi:proteasome activator subunit 3 (PA28 gamma)